MTTRYDHSGLPGGFVERWQDRKAAKADRRAASIAAARAALAAARAKHGPAANARLGIHLVEARPDGHAGEDR